MRANRSRPPKPPSPVRPEPASYGDATRLLHELEVHQTELQLQNEELRLARTELEAALQRSREVFDFAPVGYATLSVDGTITELNHAGAAMLGRDRLELTGLRFTELVEKGDRTAFAALMVKAVSGVARNAVELKVRSGSRAATLSMKAISLTRAEPTVLLTFEDVTEDRARERTLADTQRALADADRRKDDFLAALSHELRNPLTPIRNSLFVLRHRGSSDEHALKARAVIERQTAQMSRLIDDLLDVTRIARGKIALQKECVELSELVRKTIDDHVASFQQSGIKLESRFEGGPCFVDADPARLVQVLTNLLGNALKFTSPGGSVVVSVRHEGAKVSLSVKDDGLGIEPELVDHVFESFVQAPQTLERSRGGLGLGLAMVKGLVELHGGAVTAHSDGRGKGTEVSIRLPSRPAAAIISSVPSISSARPRKVLLIEDNVDACTSMRDALEINGHRVEVAYDGRKGLEVAQRFQPEVVFCDLGLPGMNGYAVARAFRAEPSLRDIYLIALSGYARPEDVIKATEAGFNQHLAKPPPIELVEQVIAQSPVTGRSEAEPPPPQAPVIH